MDESRPDAELAGRIGKASLYCFIGFLSLSALFAIITVLFGEFGRFESNVIVTTSVIAVASVCSLCCTAYARRRGRSWLSMGGVALSLAAAAAVIVGVWERMESAAYWKTAAVLGVFAVASAHALALLAVRLPESRHWLQIATTASISLLAAVIAAMIVADSGDERVVKLMAVLAILVTLGTLVVPILARLARAARGRGIGTLSLTRRADGLYEDERGGLYEVTPVPHEPASDDA
jgi:hypothetical protein